MEDGTAYDYTDPLLGNDSETSKYTADVTDYEQQTGMFLTQQLYCTGKCFLRGSCRDIISGINWWSGSPSPDFL
jgi:hypothetical protein